ncbi:MAG: ABC transporter ATP-binding protein [Clostridia bacterium]|nr:ABC transporter ATP-binding protein [Clostridia bacterium]
MAKMGPPKGKKFEKPKDTKQTVKRLWGYLKQSKALLITVIVLVIITAAIDMASIYVLAPIIDDYIMPMVENQGANEYVSGLAKMIGIFLGLDIAYVICNYISSKIMIKVSQNTVMTMRNELVEKIEKLPIKYFDTHPHGELMSRITNDMDNLSNTLNTSITQIISGICTLILALIAMFSINVLMSLISIVIIPIIAVVVVSISKITRRQFVKQQECLAKVNGYVEEYISGQKVIKAFNKEDDVIDGFEQVNETLRKEGFKAQFTSGAVMPISGAINQIGTAFTMILAGIFAINGKITIGNIVSFNKFSNHFGRPINEIANQFNVIQSGLAGAERMFNIMDEEEEHPDNEGKQLLEQVRGHVEFRNVSFGYDENKLVIKNFNLEANPGEMIALVGPTGAGKTTIINLLTRFYDVTEGEILIDGKNIKDLDKYSLRDALGIVLQDTMMFSETVKENIRYGKLEASDEEIKEAAKLANAHQFIKRLPQGYDTMLAEDGGNISVGQRQLLNISRVILNDPDILILDEATSNVDTRTEVQVQDAMNKLLDGRTSFVIAHRLSTIHNADKIVVINHGEIVEQGNHDELIKNKGMYYTMYTGMFDSIEE